MLLLCSEIPLTLLLIDFHPYSVMVYFNSSFLRSGWRLIPVIVKANDDLRQEQCVCQLVAQMHRILLAGLIFCNEGFV